jgi:hypothetical protein
MATGPLTRGPPHPPYPSSFWRLLCVCMHRPERPLEHDAPYRPCITLVRRHTPRIHTMKLATLLASIVPLLFMATNVGADLGHTLGPVGDVPIQMPGPDNPGEKVVHTKPNPSITSPGPNSTSSIGSSPIKNHCGVDGVVPHSYMVTLKSPLPSDSVPTSAGLNTNMGDLSFLKGWFQKYTPDTSKPGPPNPDSAHALHYFMQTQLAVAIEASDDVCGTPSTRPSRPSGPFLCAAPMCSHGPTCIHRTRSP